MITLSNALPIQFWALGTPTYNESKPGFVLARPYYHELLDVDLQKLQLTNTDNKTYFLYFTDEHDNLITQKQFTASVVGGLNIYDIEFTFKTLPVSISDQRIRIYLAENPGTFDDTFDYTFQPDAYVYKTDLLDVKSQIDANLGWGSQVINYRSLTNYYDIVYPNDSVYFNLRVPCRLYYERIQQTENEILLSDSIVVTSRMQKFQIFMEPYQLPAYMLKKIAAALSHDVSGSVQINGVEYQASDAFDWSPTEVHASFFKGKVWLTEKETIRRNII